MFLAGIIVFGCNEDRQNEKDSDIFQINIPLTSGDKPLFADSLFCGKEIVPLETTPECLISQIDKLEIADDGDGFPAELLKSGIQPFRKGTEEAEHLGMGLYICNLLCRKHGGTLKIANTDIGAVASAILKIS